MSNDEARELEEMLANLDNAVQRVQVNERGGFEIPEGEYAFYIDKAEICKAQSSRRIHVRMDLVVGTGQYEGFPVRSYDLRFTDSEGKEDLRSIGFFKLACSRLGLGAPEGMDACRDAVSKMPGRVFIGRVKKSGDFTNVQIQRLLSDNHTRWVTEGCVMDNEADRPATPGW